MGAFRGKLMLSVERNTTAREGKENDMHIMIKSTLNGPNGASATLRGQFCAAMYSDGFDWEYRTLDGDLKCGHVRDWDGLEAAAEAIDDDRTQRGNGGRAS